MVVPPTYLDRLRGELRTRRAAIAVTAEAHSTCAYPTLKSLIGAAQCIGLYRPFGGEPDPLPLIGTYAGNLALPLVTDHMHMAFRRWHEGDLLLKSTWGGHQPIATSDEVGPDFIFVPLLGFDADMNRIGQGGGYYDRYLSAHPSACRIGLAWDGQRVESIARRPWDIPMDGILTETTFYIKDLTRCLHH